MTKPKSSLEKAREQLGPEPHRTDTAVLQQQRAQGAVSARGPPDGLDYYLRFSDLKARGICTNWVTLKVLVTQHGFPPGILLGSKIRAWPSRAVAEWLSKQSEAA